MTNKLSRRKFLELSSTTAGAAVVGSGLTMPILSKPSAFKQINPSIPNSKTVCCVDPGMVTKPASSGTFTAQNGAVNTQRVQDNIDAMAMALSGKKSVTEAWAAIFQRGSKEWSQIKAVIKVNCQKEYGTAHAAVIGAVCHALSGLGVSTSNIKIVDGAMNPQDANNISGIFSPYIGKQIPAGVQAVKINDSMNRANFVTNGSTDIYINIASNKGHIFDWTGYVTLTMKNNYGAFNPWGLGVDGHTPSALFGLAKHGELVGGTPPLQQLCIVDSLWAVAAHENWGSYDKCPSCLLMGTLSSVVDYVTVKKVRESIMGATHTANIINRFLSDFEVSSTDVDAQYTLIAGSKLHYQEGSGSIAHEVSVHVISNGKNIAFQVATGMPYQIKITTLNGKIVRSFTGTGGPGQRSLWDGRDAAGSPCARGTYAVQCITGETIQSGSLRF